MTELTQVRINTPLVSNETIDDEVIIINMKQGNYYSLRNTGADIWSLIQTGVDSSKFTDKLTQKYEGDRTAISKAVDQFLNELIAEELIVTTPVNSLTNTENNGSLAKSASEKQPFEAPVLEKYTDMQDLLLLDPIHQVDETGWPRKKAGLAA